MAFTDDDIETIVCIGLCILAIYFIGTLFIDIITSEQVSYTEEISSNIYSLQLQDSTNTNGQFIFTAGYVSGGSKLKYIFYIDNGKGKILSTADALTTEIIETSYGSPRFEQTIEYTGTKFKDVDDIIYHSEVIKQVLYIPLDSVQINYEL